MEKKKILIFLIILLIVIIMLLFLMILNVNNQNIANNSTNNNLLINSSNVNKPQTNNGSIIEEPSNEEAQNDEFVLNTTDYFDVKINSVYYTIKNVADEFFEKINKIDANTEKLYNTLGKEYISKKGITKQNLKTTFSKYSNSTFNVEKIREKIIENNICIFIVYGTINEKDTYNMAIITDETNLTYAIYPYEYLKENDINNLKITNIDENEYNKLVYKDINQETLAQYHMTNYKYYAQNNVEKLYEKLDIEYGKKRFGSLEKFKEYINDSMNTITTSSLKSYKVTRDGDTVQYSCIDNYGNYYIFKETAAMQYTLMLDNYTIMSEDETKFYNELEKFDKGKYNLVKFISMVNTKDYNAIYNVLDNNFRENNFKNISDLEAFIKNNMYSLNNIEIDDLDKDSYEYYVFECTIKNMKNEEQKKEMTIIINQSEGTDFTMSFSFK